MPYTVETDFGLAERKSMMQIADATSYALSGVEGTETNPYGKRFAQLVYTVNPNTINLSGDVIVDGGAIADGIVQGLSAYFQNNVFTDEDLAIAGNGTSKSISTSAYTNHTVQIVATSVSAVCKIEGSLNGTDWFNLSVNADSLTAVPSEAMTFTGKTKYIHAVNSDSKGFSLYYMGE